MLRLPLALLPVALLLAGCGEELEPVTFEPLASSQSSLYLSPARLVVRDADAWDAAWQKLGTGGPAPVVDFAADMVVVVALGVRGDSGAAVEISRVRLGDALEVTATELFAGEACFTIPVETRPAVAVRLARTDAPPRWLARKRAESCS